MSDDLTLFFTGDLVLDVDQADHWLSGIAPTLLSADLTIGHLEVPHTRRGQEMSADVPAPGAPPENLDAIARAGVGVLTLAGNHIADCGAEGIQDTITHLQDLGIAHCGAGATLAEARQPALREIRGRRLAVLSYNCVGPEAAWAGTSTAGCSYLPLISADGGVVTPKSDLREIAPATFEILAEDIATARRSAELVVVALHKGIVHTPARLAPYEQPLARAAVEAGADIVVGHHAHILRGIDFHNGRPIFHGLGNGCVVTHALSPTQDHPGRAEWAKRRKLMFGFEPDPRYVLAPFHPEAVNAVIGTVKWNRDGTLSCGVVPVHVEPPGRPVRARGNLAREVIAYLQRIGREAGLSELSWREDADSTWSIRPA